MHSFLQPYATFDDLSPPDRHIAAFPFLLKHCFEYLHYFGSLHFGMVEMRLNAGVAFPRKFCPLREVCVPKIWDELGLTLGWLWYSAEIDLMA